MEQDVEQLNAREVARLLALVENERRYYQEIVASIPVGLLILSSDLNIVSSNREVRKIFGLRSGDPLRGKMIDQFLPASILDQVRDILAAGAQQLRVPIAIPGEPESSWRINIRTIRNWDDNSQQQALLTIERTDPGPATGQEPEFDETPLPVTGLLDSLDAVIWALDIPTKQFLFVNEKAQELLGFPVEKWLATPTFWTDRIYSEDREWMLKGYAHSIDNWARHRCEYRANTSYGKIVWLRETARILSDESGQARHLIGLALDITQQRLLETQYVQAQRVESASRLATRASHEIANQVMIISGYAEDLLNTMEPASPMRSDVREISAATNRLRTLMGQLSSPAKTQARPADPIDLNELLKRLEPQIRVSFASTSRLEVKLFPASIAVRARGSELQQTILALVRRARLASRSGGQISIESSPVEIDSLLGRPDPTLPSGVYGVITIEDEGDTLDPAARTALFESWIHNPSDSDEASLNFAQMYQWVRQWGGDIAVSPRLPQGNVFQIFLPRVGDSMDAPTAAAPAVYTTPELAPEPLPEPEFTKTIVVVSEESGIRTLLTKMLRRENYQVLEASGLEAMLQRGAENTGPIDLLIADASLPHITRSQTIARLRESAPDAKLLFLTAMGESDEPQKLPEGSESLQKPFTLRALVNKANELLAT